MLRTPFIESDLFVRSAQWRGRDELFVDDADRITGAGARFCAADFSGFCRSWRRAGRADRLSLPQLGAAQAARSQNRVC
jgi:hypothetical protein